MVKPALGDKVANVLGQCMYSLMRLLPIIGEQLISVCPEILLEFERCSNGTQGSMGVFSCSPQLWCHCLLGSEEPLYCHT